MKSFLFLNDSIEVEHPVGKRQKYECESDGDSKTIVFEVNGAGPFLLLLVWNNRTIHWQNYRDILPNIPPFKGSVTEDVFKEQGPIELSSDGMFKKWHGGYSQSTTHKGTFSDFELVSSDNDLHIYFRFLWKDLKPASEQVLTGICRSIRVTDPSSWVVTNTKGQSLANRQTP